MRSKMQGMNIGKNGVTEQLISEIKLRLKKHKKLKIKILKSGRVEKNKKEIAEEVAAKTRGKILDVRGNRFVLGKKREKKMSNEKLKKKVKLYLKKAEPMFENLILIRPKKIDLERVGKEFYEMAFSYYEDAGHFYENEEYDNALAALEYAEGWLDAGRRLGIFKVK